MDWDRDFLARSPMFEPLRASVPAFGREWPDIGELQRLVDRREPPVCNAGGLPLRLVPPARRTGAPEDRYEARAFLRGELEVRDRNWHDLFNVLVWLTFPRAKAALNARHYAEERARREDDARSMPDSWRRPPGNRGPAQDALTLFDEGGIIVASTDDDLLGMLRASRWKDLFWRRRDNVRAHMRFLVFGHALYEKALAPFTGITARGILLSVPAGLLEAPAAERMAMLDARLASRIGDPGTLTVTRELAPVPVLGVPGWRAENEREAYYDNVEYFRSGRRE